MGGQGAADAGIAHAAHQAFAVGVGDHAIGAAEPHQLQQLFGRIATTDQQATAPLPQICIKCLQIFEHEGHAGHGCFRVKQQIAIQHENRQDRSLVASFTEGCVVAEAQVTPKPHHRARHGVSLGGRGRIAVWLRGFFVARLPPRCDNANVA